MQSLVSKVRTDGKLKSWLRVKENAESEHFWICSAGLKGTYGHVYQSLLEPGRLPTTQMQMAPCGAFCFWSGMNRGIEATSGTDARGEWDKRQRGYRAMGYLVKAQRDLGEVSEICAGTMA